MSCFFIHRDAPPASLLRLRRKDLETLLGDGLEKASFFIFDFRFIRVSFYSSTIRAIGLTARFFIRRSPRSRGSDASSTSRS